MPDRISYKRDIVWPIVYQDFFLEFKKKWPDIKCNIVGSVRREQENIHDFDLVVGSKEQEIIKWCANKIQNKLYPVFIKADGFIKNIPIQIWFCDESEYGPYLLLKTGPYNFNMKLANIAKRNGLTLSEHGLYLGTYDNKIKRIDENTEASIIWIILGCKWIHPKDRNI